MVQQRSAATAPPRTDLQLGHSLAELTVAVALSDGHLGRLPELAETGVTELVLVAATPDDPAAATWVAELAAEWCAECKR